MAQYRKKPVVIEAMQFNDNAVLSDFQTWLTAVDAEMTCRYNEEVIAIQTLEGTMTANKGDWIIKGVAGELYPCKPDIFEKTYEPV